MSKKRLREAPAVDTELVEIYEDLANNDEDIRLKAAQNLLIKASPTSGLAVGQLKEILRRLIRGLCSGRRGARLGFSIALTELQSQLFGANARTPFPISIVDFVDSLKIETEAGGNVSGQEKRDHHFGRLFGAETVIKSGILFDAHVDDSLWSRVVDLIVELAKRKSWLREECGWILYQTIQGSQRENFSSKYVQIVIDKFKENELIDTPEGVAIWIATSESYPTVRFPKGIWKHENPLHRKERARLATILREAPPTSFVENKGKNKASQRGTWSSKLHFTWEVIMDRLLKGRSSNGKPSIKSPNELNFPDFWEECVDKSLFADSSSNERKYWGFLLFQRIFQHAPQFPVEVPFSRNLMRCLMNQLSSPERYLHLAAEKAIKAILRRVQLETPLALPSLKGLMSPPNGEINFDLITKTKTVEKLVALVTDQCLSDLLQFLRRLAINPGVQDEKGLVSRRRIIGDLLIIAVRSRSIDTGGGRPIPTEQGTLQILSLLVELAYFTRSNRLTDDPPITPASHDMFKGKISSCLTELTSKSTNPSLFAYHVVCVIISRQKLPNSSTPLLVMDDAVAEVIGKAWRVLEKISSEEQSSSAEKRPFLTAFKLLYSLMILQVYNGDADAVTMLDELRDSYHKLLDSKKSRIRGGPEALVEIILGLVAKPALLFRRIGPHVFSAVAPDINESALQSMVQVLMTKENMLGQGEMFENDDEVADSMSDVEQIDTSELVGDDSLILDDDSTADSTNEGSDISSDTGEDDDELAAFDAKLAQALGTGSTKKDGEANSDDEPSDEDMEDEQMEALDEQLAKVFKERKIATSKKSQRKDAKERIINFKCRVLELLEIFIKEQQTNPLGLKLLIPLLTTIRTTQSNLVSKKACDLIREYSRLCKGKNLPTATDQDSTFDLLTATHSEATREGSNAYTSACSQTSLLLVKVLVAQDREHLRRVVLQYAATQERFLFDPQCKVKTSFFSDWLNWCNSARK